MIYIKIDGHRILADDNGTPINPPQYWLDDPNRVILNGIAEAYAGGKYEAVPDAVPVVAPNFELLKQEISWGNNYFLIRNWYNELLPSVRDPFQIAIARQDITAMQQCLSNMTVSVDVAAEINELFLLCDISIVL